MVILDTSIVIDHLRQPPERSKFLQFAKDEKKSSFAISIVSIQELYEGQSTRSTEIESKLLSTLAFLEILPYSYEVAKLAGEVARDLGRPIDLADAAIAATAILNHAELATLNNKDFSGISDLQLI